MAMIEKIYGGIEIINLTASVGENSVNLKDDVMVVQAMLKYSLRENPAFSNFKLPEPTGAMNDQTKVLIKEYQRFMNRKRKGGISVDGVIDRAVGERPFGRRGEWTIFCLNSQVLEARLLSGGEGNEFEDLCRRFPQLYAVLDNLPVGSLRLSLEGARRGVGTLNLALE